MTDPRSLTVLITGASSGFGAAMARRYADAGARLVLAARRTDRLEAMRDTLSAPVHLLGLDVRDRAAVAEEVANLPAEFANIDVLINNAGLALGLEPAFAVDLDDWETMVDTNVKGVLYMTRAILPGMVERNRGHVVTIGSVAGSFPYPGGNVYGATKSFVEQFMLNLKSDLAGTRVRATCIEPGLATSEFSLVRFKGEQAKAEAIYEGTEPMTPDDIAEAVFWVTTLPGHVNINRLEMMPVCQSFSPFKIERNLK